MHPYFLEIEAQTRWDNLHRLAAAGPRRPEARHRLGAALVGLGNRIAGSGERLVARPSACPPAVATGLSE